MPIDKQQSAILNNAVKHFSDRNSTSDCWSGMAVTCEKQIRVRLLEIFYLLQRGDIRVIYEACLTMQSGRRRRLGKTYDMTVKNPIG